MLAGHHHQQRGQHHARVRHGRRGNLLHHGRQHTGKSDALDPINGGSINPASTRYTGAFAANSGDRVRAAAFAFGYNSSSINQEIIA